MLDLNGINRCIHELHIESRYCGGSAELDLRVRETTSTSVPTTEVEVQGNSETHELHPDALPTTLPEADLILI